MPPPIAIVGGTGPEGRGLALRFAMAGYPIVIGSRDAGRAADAVAGLLNVRGGLPITGATNDDAVQSADWVVLAVPFEGLEARGPRAELDEAWGRAATGHFGSSET